MVSEEVIRTPTAALVRRTLELYDAKEFDRLDEVMHDDVNLTFLGVTSVGLEKVKAGLVPLYEAIPDHFHRIERMTVDEEHEAVAIEMLVGGNHIGTPFPTSFGPIPASGKYVEWRPGSFIRARDGKVMEWTVYLDQVSVLKALGVALVSASPAEV
jgi:ketosteroid isomerase-like protein